LVKGTIEGAHLGARSAAGKNIPARRLIVFISWLLVRGVRKRQLVSRFYQPRENITSKMISQYSQRRSNVGERL
jgi:hypothetical protein